MDDELNVMTKEAPTLVFDTPPQPKEMPAAAQDGSIKPVEPPKPEELDDSVLSEEEKKQVDAFVGQIDVTNSAAILQYGVGTQKKLADFSDKALENVRTKDLGEVGNMITSLVTELKNFGDEEESKGLFGLFKKSGNRLAALKTRYSKAESSVNEIVEALEGHQVQLMKDVDLLDRMYQVNLTYFKELTMYLLAGKKKLAQVRSTDLAELQQKAQNSGLPEDAQEAKDLAEMCDRFEKKLHDLELTRMVSLQTGPQIRMVQNSNTLMIEKIQSTIVNTIPLWKSQMVIAMGVEHSTQAAKAQREVSDMTNELLKKNADALKIATVESAKESERGIVDMETLKHTNETLISTLDEVLQIQTEGKQRRREAEKELSELEGQLKNKILEISKS